MSGLVTFGPRKDASKNKTYIDLSGSVFHLLIEEAREVIPSYDEAGIEVLTTADMVSGLSLTDDNSPRDVRRRTASALLKALPTVRKEVETAPRLDREVTLTNLKALDEIGQHLETLLR